MTELFTGNTYNNKSWSFLFLIKENDISMTSPSKIDNEERLTPIPTNAVTYFSFINSMSSFVPTAIFEIQDLENISTNKIRAQNIRIMVHASHTIADDNVEEINLTFLITKYTVINIAERGTGFRIWRRT